ncbi:MAG: malonic semialdehyde reductase [Alphaproteobacteria bacterium]|nr:malonic semialdehyde reductase [Alphaproteobacteria bacterium]
MGNMLDDQGLDLLFRKARTHNGWAADAQVSDAQLHAIYDIVKCGPTSANCSPARILFLKTAAAKERLRPALSEGNLAKTMAAPVCAIIAYDIEFYEHLPMLFPHDLTAKTWFNWSAAHAETTAFRNGTLQGAYLMLAARAVGLDIGAMSGFDNAAVDKEFFPDGKVKSNFLCNIGRGDESQIFARHPKFSFDEVCKIL